MFSEPIDSDSENTAPVRMTKRVRKAGSFDLQAFLEDERIRRDEFQNKMLMEIERGNEQFAKSSEATQNFQNNFLALLQNVLQPRN